MGFKRHASYLMILRAAILVSGTITSIIVARTLGAEDKGKLELAIIVFPILVASMGSLGTRAASVYFSSYKGGAANIHKITLTVSLLLGIFYSGTLILFKDTAFVQDTLLKGLTTPLIVLCASLIPLQLLGNTADGLLQGRFRFGTHVLIHLSGLAVRLVGIVVLLGFLGYQLMGAVAVYILSIFVPAALTLAAVLGARYDGPRVTTKQAMGYGLQAWWGAAAQRANMQLDSLVVNAFIDNASLGIYSIATLFSRPMLQIPGALGQALFPRVASRDHMESAQDVALLNRNWLWLGAVVSVGVGLLATWLIAPVFGEVFAPAAHALWAMLPGVLGFGMSAILTQYLTGTGRPTLASIASTVALVVNIPALVFLVPNFGIVGAGLAISTTYWTRALTMAYFYQRTSSVPLRHYMIPRRSDLNYYRRAARYARKRLTGRA